MTPLGKGVFAGRRFTAEELIGKIRGEVIHDVDYTSDYCMELTDTSVLEPRGAYRYLNHSCNPNCELVIFDTSDEGSTGRSKSSAAPPPSPQLWLQTTRAIALGEELTIDYAWPADAAIPCGCSTANCRGWVVDESELAEVQRRQARQQRERARAEKTRSTRLANGRADKASPHGQSQVNGSKLKRNQLAEKEAQVAKPKNAKASSRKLLEKTGRNISKLTGSSATSRLKQQRLPKAQTQHGQLKLNKAEESKLSSSKVRNGNAQSNGRKPSSAKQSATKQSATKQSSTKQSSAQSSTVKRNALQPPAVPANTAAAPARLSKSKGPKARVERPTARPTASALDQVFDAANGHLAAGSAVAARPAASARAVAPLNPPRSGLRKTHSAHALAAEHLTRSRTARSSR